jgi:hypothetical protein
MLHAVQTQTLVRIPPLQGKPAASLPLPHPTLHQHMFLTLRHASTLFRRPIAKLQKTPLHIQQASFSRTARSMASEYKLKGLTSVDLKNGQKAEYVSMPMRSILFQPLTTTPDMR